MNVLLDTHTLLWLVSTPSDVDASALAVISDPNTSVWVTAASAWEIAIKTRLVASTAKHCCQRGADIIADMSTARCPSSRPTRSLAGRLPGSIKILSIASLWPKRCAAI